MNSRTMLAMLAAATVAPTTRLNVGRDGTVYPGPARVAVPAPKSPRVRDRE